MPHGYKKFEQSVLSSAEKQAKQIIINAQKYRSDALRGLNVVPSDELVRRLDIVNQQVDHRTAKAQQELRRGLLLYRCELAEEMFSSIEQKLDDLRANVLFKKNMEDRLIELSDEIGRAVMDGEDMKLLVKKGDAECFANLLSTLVIRFNVDYAAINASENIEIVPDDTIKIGGFVLKIGRMRYDCTLDSRLAKERERFYAGDNFVIV